jgi:hypothetical protein
MEEETVICILAVLHWIYLPVTLKDSFVSRTIAGIKEGAEIDNEVASVIKEELKYITQLASAIMKRIR